MSGRRCKWRSKRQTRGTTGRITVLSDQGGDAWMYDYRFLEAVR
jgi:hypothetical protein